MIGKLGATSLERGLESDGELLSNVSLEVDNGLGVEDLFSLNIIENQQFQSEILLGEPLTTATRVK